MKSVTLKPVSRVQITISLVLAGALAIGILEYVSRVARASQAPPSSTSQAPQLPAEISLDLTESQVRALRIQPAVTQTFALDRQAVGNIQFNDDVAVQVFPPYAGTVLRAMVDLGDRVNKDQPLYTIKSPDLVQAESTLIAASATFDLTSKVLARARSLQDSHGIPEKEVEQAVSDQQAAEGALKAARDAVRIFGKTDAEIDRIVASRQIDPALVVRSPISGKVTARNVQPGLFVQPGTAPAPFSVADVKGKWMVASVPETESPLFHPGQTMKVEVLSFPGRAFPGKVFVVGESVDPNTRRVVVRSEIADPKDELRDGMMASFSIRVQEAQKAVSVPANAVVRESDGTHTVWTTADRRHFTQQTVQVGVRDEDRIQILEGLKEGHLVVVDGTIFLSNMLKANSGD